MLAVSHCCKLDEEIVEKTLSSSGAGEHLSFKSSDLTEKLVNKLENI